MKRYFLLMAVFAAGTAHAWGWGDCEHERTVEATLNLEGSETLAIRAAAGDLRVTGRSGTSQAKATGKICASDEEWLEESKLVTDEGKEARIAVSLPDSSGWTFMGNQYLYMDLEIEVPDHIALDIRDSSGDMKVENTASVRIQDSSGDINLEDVKGAVTLEDSSGDIDLLDITGDVVVVRDSSGDIRGRDIEGSVRVEKDSSGDIRFRNVSADFVVEKDSSGDIVADGIGGDFRVLKDSSGDIRSSGVTGEVDVPSD
ncbi:MAG: DUF4097 family beta strand repeat-containing protein [Lysobacterales bacterium]